MIFSLINFIKSIETDINIKQPCKRSKSEDLSMSPETKTSIVTRSNSFKNRKLVFSEDNEHKFVIVDYETSSSESEKTIEKPSKSDDQSNKKSIDDNNNEVTDGDVSKIVNTDETDIKEGDDRKNFKRKMENDESKPIDKEVIRKINIECINVVFKCCNNIIKPISLFFDKYNAYKDKENFMLLELDIEEVEKMSNYISGVLNDVKESKYYKDKLIGYNKSLMDKIVAANKIAIVVRDKFDQLKHDIKLIDPNFDI